MCTLFKQREIWDFSCNSSHFKKYSGPLNVRVLTELCSMGQNHLPVFSSKWTVYKVQYQK